MNFWHSQKPDENGSKCFLTWLRLGDLGLMQHIPSRFLKAAAVSRFLIRHPKISRFIATKASVLCPFLSMPHGAGYPPSGQDFVPFPVRLLGPVGFALSLAGQLGPVFVCSFYWRSAPTARRLVAVSTMVSATGRGRHPRSRSALALENRRFLPSSNS